MRRLQASDGLSTAIQRLVEESGTDGSASVLFLDEAAEDCCEISKGPRAKVTGFRVCTMRRL